MPIIPTVIHRLKGNTYWDYIFNLVWPSAGTYPAGGEPLDFTPYINITKRQPVWVEIQIFGYPNPIIPTGTTGYHLWYDKVIRTVRVRAGSIYHTHMENTAGVYTQNAETENPTASSGIWPEMQTGFPYSSTQLPTSLIEARVTFIYR